MPITLKDVARASGYSVTTVSRALTGYDDVNAETRQHIVGVAQELGYQPNQTARQLQGQRTQTIGIIMPPPVHMDEDDFYSLLIKGITYEAARHGYDILTSAQPPDTSPLDTYKRIVGGKRVDAMVVARTNQSDPRIAYLQSVDCPFIVIGRYEPDKPNDFHYIDVDSQHGIRLVTDHLIQRGHTRIGIILPDNRYAFSPYRLMGYQEALAAAGLPFRPSYRIYGNLTYASGRDAAQQLLQDNPELTAIVACNDWMALGAIDTANSLGYSVGDDFAVTGFDNIPAATHAGLTTVHQSIYEMGEELIQQLMNIINDAPTNHYQRLIKPNLIVRGSSGGSASE
jgi:LacI family transcriptional regulator